MIIHEFENLDLQCDGSFNAPLHEKLKLMSHGTFLTQHNTRATFHARFYCGNALQNLQQIASLNIFRGVLCYNQLRYRSFRLTSPHS